MRFFFSASRNFEFTWNNANKTDWQIIRRFFIAAYVNAYAYIYKDGQTGEDPLEMDDQWKNRAQVVIDKSIKKAKDFGFEALTVDIFSPLQYFYKINFEEDEKILSSCLKNDTMKKAESILQYIKHLLTLIYYFEDSYNGEKAAIEQAGLEGGFPIQYVLARLHDRPIAFISCVQNYKSGRVNLRWVNMSPGFQGEGLGRRMLEEVMKRYPHSTGLELYTRKLNKGAMHFYPSCGLPAEETIYGSLLELSMPERVGVWLSEKGIFPPDDDLITAHYDTYIGFQGKLTKRKLSDSEDKKDSVLRM